VNVEIMPVAGHELGDVSLAKRASDMLQKHYPGHLWAVHVDSDNGMVYVLNMAFSSRYGYKLKLTRCRVTRICGVSWLRVERSSRGPMPAGDGGTELCLTGSRELRLATNHSGESRYERKRSGVLDRPGVRRL